MTTLLTFLGTGNYSCTTYSLNGQRYASCYCPAALARFLSPSRILVFVTEDARKTHGKSLREELKDTWQVEEVDIPAGKGESELWEIFAILTAHVEPGESLVVDITHGFRSLPFLSFLAIAFLRVAKSVEVKKIYYGAYDARDKEANETPVFDLTPFVNLLDWTIATDRFLRFGDAGDLAQLHSLYIPTGQEAAGDKQVGVLKSKLQRVTSSLEEVSLPARLSNTFEFMEKSPRLIGNLDAARDDVKERTPPLALLLDKIRETYDPFALCDSDQPAQGRQSLDIQRRMIRRYLDSRQYIQAITLAREWIISWLILCQTGEHFLDRSSRKDIERRLGSFLQRDQQETAHCETESKGEPSEYEKQVINLWHPITEVRNQINHAAMTGDRKPSAGLLEKIKGIIDEIDKLPLPTVGKNQEESPCP